MLKKVIFSIFLVTGVVCMGISQPITNYAFSPSLGTFTNISGGTSPTHIGTTDEGYFNGIPIGFDFWYMGVRYTTISASTNGWLTLGANITNASPTNSLTSGGAPRPIIAPLWDNLDLSPATKVGYVTTGTTGTRIFIIQYLNTKWISGATGNTMSFQAKLYEGTGKIEFVYDPQAGTAVSPTASIGLSAISTGSGNFLSVSNVGTSASSTFEASITTKPVSGRTYAFTPPVPATPGSLSFPVVNTTDMTLNWTDLSSSEKGFALYISTDGITYTFYSQAAANATSASATSLTAGTLYYWKIYAVSEGAMSAALSGSQTTVCSGSPVITATLTATCVGGSTGTITALATGGSAPYTYSLNSGTYQSSPNFTGLAAGIYKVNGLGTSGCVSSISVTVIPFANSADDQNATALDSWIGHMYDGINFNSYIGQFTELENFNEFFGGSTACFNVVSNSVTRSIYTETISVKFKMVSTKKGLYVVDLGSDDGARLTIDGVLPYNSFLYQSFVLRPAVLINLNGSSSLLYEFFENSGTNQVMFQNLTPVFSNVLSSNLTQSVCIGNAASPISGNAYGSLPSGITLSGTGYQWSYSTTFAGVRTNIAGATAASLTPSTAAAPFNAAGTYYVYRNATLSSTNNVSPNPYVATNESNAATVVINAGGQWTGSISTDWANPNNWCIGAVPTSTTDVIINSSAVRMPSISSSVNSRSLTINSGATLTIGAAGILNIAGTLINNGTVTNNGTTNFNGTTGQQTFSGISSFYNLTLSNSSGLLFPSAITVNNNLTLSAGTLNTNNFNVSVKGNWVNNSSATAFTAGSSNLTFNGTIAQSIGGSFSTTFNNLILFNTTNPVVLSRNISIAGDLSVSSGIFDLAGFTANRSSSGGTLTLANAATLRIGGVNTFPSNYTTNTLVVASTVEYAGLNQTVSNQVYGNLLLTSASGASVKTFPATPLTIVGNLSSLIGTGTSVSFTAASALTVNGNVSIGASTTFNGASFLHTVAGNWTNAGTYNGNTSTITLTGSGALVSGSGSHNFNHLVIAAPAIIFSADTFSVNGNFSTTGSGSTDQTSGGTLLMTGTGTTITGSGIKVDNMTISGTVTTAASLTLTGNFSVSGSFVASAGAVTLSGASKTISGAGTKNFSTLSVAGTISTASDFSISSGLSIIGSLTATAGTATFTNTSTISGSADLFNATLNGITLQLTSNSILGIANVLTITSGTLDLTSSIPNTVNFNGAAQNVNALNYYNLTLSNSNTKTALGAITINNTITIDTGTTFLAGSFTHSVYNDWINNGTFTAGTGTIQFLGAANSSIAGANTFNVLTINNSTDNTEIILLNNISVATINMINGTLLTGSNTLTLTTTRTGNGSIYGAITRTHLFTPGVAYEFKNPNNFILFSSVSSVSSITVLVEDIDVIDFPFGGGINEVYTITVPAGTYNATLRLSYEDDELNGNSESSMALWNYNGTSWNAVGKTANNTITNYVEKNALTSITNRWTLSDNSNVVRWNGSASTDWNTAANWTTIQGSSSTPPGATDIVQIGTAAFTNQPTISSNVVTNNIQFGSAQAATLTLVNGGSLTTSGNIAGNWSTTRTHAIVLNNQNLTVNGDLILSDDITGHAINLSIGSGTVNITGSLIESGGANIDFIGAGVLNIHKDFLYTTGTFTPGSGTVSYVGDQNQHLAHVTYNDLIINKAAGLAEIDDVATIGGNLTVTAGELDNYANCTIVGNVTISSGATLQNFNILHVGGNWLNNGVYNASGASIFFDGTGTQTISASTFNNLNIDKPVGTTAVLTGDIAIKGDFTILSGTFDVKTFDCNRITTGGTLTLAAPAIFIVGGNNSPLNFINGALDIASTVIADGVNPQFIFGVDFGNLIFRNGGLKTLVSPITVNGDLTIESGASFSGGAETLTLNGNWINNGTYIPSTATTIQSGSTKTISGNTTFNKVIVNGSYTNLANITYNDLLHITSSGSISGGSGVAQILHGDLINNGILNTTGTTTFTGAVLQTLSLINAVSTFALIVNFNGTVSPVLNSTSPPQYGFLNINNTGGVNPSVDWTIAFALTVGSGASFNGGTTTQNLLGSLTNNGTITSNGTFNFVPSASTSLNMGSTFSSNGLVNFGGAGAITLSGTPLSLHNVLISNTHGAGITPTSNWNLGNNFTINSGSIFNAGAFTHLIGGSILNQGVLNSSASTFTMNGSATQDIYSNSAFNNLIVNNAAGIVTLSSSVTVNGALNFITGKIQTDNHTLIQSSSGTVTGAAQATGWINGKLQKSIATGTSTKTFEAGDNASYTPVVVTFTGVTTAGNLIVQSIAGDHPLLASSTINPASGVNRYWTITNIGIAYPSYDATFNFVASDIDGGATTSAFGVELYDGVSWILPVVTAPNPTNIKANGITSTGDFAIGEICNPGTTIAYTLSPYCSNGGTAAVTTTGATGGTYSSAAGLTINSTTGAITLATSSAGDYIVSYTLAASGSCSQQIITTPVTVTAAPVATLSYAGSPYIISAGTAAITFTGTPSGTFTSAPGLSINSATGLITLNTSSAATYVVTYTIPALGGCALYTATTSVTLTNAIKTWDGGAITSLWGDANNWNPDGVPIALDNIDLLGANSIDVNVAALANNITLNNAGLTLTINSGSSLAVTGNLTITSGTLNEGGSNSLNLTVAGDWIKNGGSFIANTNTVGFVGTTIQNISGTSATDFNNISITNTANPGVRVQSNQNLLGVLTLASNVFFDSDGSSNTSIFRLVSAGDNPTQDASVAILPAGSQINGKVMVQRFMTKEGANNNRIYRYISSPVQYASVADLQNEIPVTGTFTGTSLCPGCVSNQSMFSYNESEITDSNVSGSADFNDGYIDFPNATNSETLVPGTGYALFVRGNIVSSTLWNVNGNINSGNVAPVSLPVSYTSSTVLANDGWNLVGNPFPSTIDWNAATGWTKANLNASIYITDNGNASQQYATWNGVTGTNNGSRYLATGQGFWTKADGAGTPLLQANENIKSSGTQTIFFREGNLTNLLRIKMVQGAVRDETVIHFRADATPGFNTFADAWKLKNATFNLSSLSYQNERLAINSWSDLGCTTSVKLSVEDAPAGEYSLAFTNLDSFDEVQIYLTDSFLNQTVVVTENTVYVFQVTPAAPSFGNERFFLTFKKAMPEVSIHTSNGILSIDEVATIQWYYNDELIPGAIRNTIVPDKSGIYSVVVNDNACESKGQIEFIVTGLEDTLPKGIKIFPNPVSGELFIVAEKESIESVMVINAIGETIGKIQLTGKSGSQKGSYDMTDKSSGIYLLKLVSGSNVYTKKIIKQ